MATAISFPFSFVNGRVATTDNSEELLTNKVISVISTQQGERIMRPNYGSNMMQFDFGIGDELEQSMMQQEAARAVSVWEPGAARVAVKFNDTPDQYGNLYASVSYVPIGGSAGIVTQNILLGVLSGGQVSESGIGQTNQGVGASSNSRYFGTQE